MKYIALFFNLLFCFSSHAQDQSGGSGDSSGGGSSSSDGIFTSLLNSILAYIKGIFEAVTDFVKWIGNLFLEVFESLWLLLTDIFIWLFESLFAFCAQLIAGVVQSLGIVELASQISSYWGFVPAETQQILQAIGIPSALAIVVSGIIIRMVLQLIPLVRLGS